MEPNVLHDERGYFFESLRLSMLEELGFDQSFVQENESMSHKGTLRGLHFQAPPFAQGKLIRVVSGSILDLAVDLRPSSQTYGQSFSIELSGKNKTSFYIPPGFAHGFYCFEDNTIVQYKCTDYYNRDSEMGILWNDPHLAIEWPEGDKIISEKDKTLPLFQDFQSPF